MRKQSRSASWVLGALCCMIGMGVLLAIYDLSLTGMADGRVVLPVEITIHHTRSISRIRISNLSNDDLSQYVVNLRGETLIPGEFGGPETQLESSVVVSFSERISGLGRVTDRIFIPTILLTYLDADGSIVSASQHLKDVDDNSPIRFVIDDDHREGLRPTSSRSHP